MCEYFILKGERAAKGGGGEGGERTKRVMEISELRIARWVVLCLTLSVAAKTVGAVVYGKTYIVGDKTGWTYINATSGKPADYAGWAAKYVFLVNDVLEFNYEPNKQNLYSFDNADAWAACNFSRSQLLDDGSSGFSQWYLPYEGSYDFASGIYCKQGQKFRIYAVNSSSVPVDEAPSPMSAPAPSSGAPSLAPTPAPAHARAPSSPPSRPSLSPTVPHGGPGPSGSGNGAPSTHSASEHVPWTQALMLVVAGVAASTIGVSMQ